MASLDVCQHDRFIPAGAGNTRTMPSMQCLAAAVHPRGRGEHTLDSIGAAQDVRFIPAGAGNTSCTPDLMPCAVRFIPAGAGNTDRLSARRIADSAVHPRGRGEHAASATRMPVSDGSSPRARGTRAQGRGSQLAVHPRGRGERARQRRRAVGSSPRARGTRPLALPFDTGGFIPAGAGNTAPRSSRTAAERFIPAGAGNAPLHWPRTAAVHPRGRGEHQAQRRRLPSDGGSSPRARGIRLRWIGRDRLLRFIPAGAGNTFDSILIAPEQAVHPRGRGEYTPRRSRSQVAGPVHPRGRGEYVLDQPQVSRSTGSSPRARGTLSAAVNWARRERFIPAGAGNTPAVVAQARPRPVHPRGRGEYPQSIRVSSRRSGSSPRARGIRITQSGRSRGDGSSPRARGIRRCTSVPLARPVSVHPRGRGEYARTPVYDGLRTGSSPRARGIRSAPLT